MNIQEIAEINAGRAMQAMEVAGVDNPILKKRIKKLIYYTAEDVAKLCNIYDDIEENSGNRL